MSYFRWDLAADLATDSDCSLESTELGVEVADGVVVERRSVLWLSAAAISTMLLGSRSLTAQDPKQTGKATQSPSSATTTTDKLTFAQFLEQLYPLAQRTVDSKGEDEEAYLMLVAAALARLEDPAAPVRAAMKTFRKQHATAGKRFPLAAMSIRLEAGRGFSHHDHLNYNGVIMGIEGEARIRNYDFVGKVPAIDSQDTFTIRETRDDLILPGRISTLGRTRENIHDLVAGKGGARVLDVFTFFEKNATSRYLEVADKPRDSDRRIYDANWKQRRPR